MPNLPMSMTKQNYTNKKLRCFFFITYQNCHQKVLSIIIEYIMVNLHMLS
ncbi:hypothetical protein HanRHA438_Chr09g0396481 [Helianthus annuus]|nr:hypothetical protein HanRHA438_Chr09g0396481 [Helianthus annuus]